MKPAHQIPVLQKAIQVLNALAAGQAEPTTTTLARALGIAPATCYRIVQTFAHAGWLHVGEDGRCELGAGLFPLLHRLQQSDLLSQRMVDTLRELTGATGIASKVSVRDGDDAVTLLRVDSPEPMALAVRPGARFHLTLGASGSILLGTLPEKEVQKIIRRAPKDCWQWQKPAEVLRRVETARRKGVVTDSGTYRPDIFGISAALCDANGHIQAALTLTGLVHGHTKTQLDDFRELLAHTAAKLNQQTKLKQS
ncbi:MAG: IclR family transcriptional regulator [Verrucomicrobia bacterium]|nr:IclR family transcriptional regulator [Verrucomicrobiota bacterium]